MNLLFYISFILYSAAIGILGMPLLVTHYTASLVMRAWATGVLLLLKVLCGVDYTTDLHVSEKGNLVVCNHQSAFEIMILIKHVPNPVFFLKHELFYVPFINLYLWRTGQLGVNRTRKGNSGHLLERAVKLAPHKNIIIFPEGERVHVNEIKEYHAGAVLLAKKLHKPITPCVTNAGYFWPKKSFKKIRGTAVLRQLDPMTCDKPARVMLKELQDTIENAKKYI